MRRPTVIIFLAFLFACQSTPPSQSTATVPVKASSQAASPNTTISLSPDSLKREMTEEIDRLTKSGFYDSTVLTDQVFDMFSNEKVDTPWVIETVTHSYRKRLVEQASWPVTTDFDRLASVFDLLNSNSIIALHNAGNTRDEGLDDANDIHKELKIKNILCRGFCCYDTQDVDGAIDGNFLYLTFGDFDENNKRCIQIGNEINATLQRCGFKTKWDRTCDTRIRIEPFVWQKRFGNKNCTYDHAKELLSHNKSS